MDILVRYNRWILAIILGSIVAYTLWYFLIATKYVTLVPAKNGRIIMTTEAEAGITLADTQTKKTVWVKSGKYYLNFSADGYESRQDPIVITKSTTISSPSDLAYTDSKLQSLLSTNKAAINAVLVATLAEFSYNLASEKLHLDGTWYSAKLIPAQPENFDSKRIILHQEKGTWKIVAGPDIVFALKDFPEIPESVIRYVNNR